MAMYMKEIGLIIKAVEKDFTPTTMALYTLVIGLMMSLMERVKKHGSMVLILKDIISKEKKMVAVNFIGQMVQAMSVNL